jgi:dihydroneopterin aldolase
MTDRISQAFGHPLERAEALAGAELRDRISLRDYLVDVDIGAFQQERGQRQRLRFNVVVEVLPPGGPVADNVDRILSYDCVTEAIAVELASERLNLLETLAERVAARVLREPRAERIFVRIEKLDRVAGALGVEIMRSHSDAQPLAEEKVAEDTPSAQVVFLGNDVIASTLVPALIDRLCKGGAPLILCCGPSDLVQPQSDAAMAQRRIGLLAIEQNAWVLAGRDKRCVVVDTRTELDWAVRQGEISVWAPSKMVLDAVRGPAVDATALELAKWLAAEMGEADVLDISDPSVFLAEGA